MMAKIRSLGNKELKQVLSLLERFSGHEFDYPVLERFKTLYLPFHKVNQFLPLGLKFLPGIYVATAEDQVMGLVWLSRDGNRRDRWKIDQVIINPESYSAYDVGKQLLYFVINQYGAAGVETFLAYVDPLYTEGLALLKDCGFRHCTKMHTFTLENNLAEEFRNRHVQIQGIREARGPDARKLQELHSETLVPEVRISLRKSPEDFYPPLLDRMTRRFQGEFVKRWVVSLGSQDYLHGSVSLATWDYKNFEISVLVSPAWEQGMEDMMLFILQQVYKCASNPRIVVNAYEFQKGKVALLEKLGFTRSGTVDILVKDYWIPVKSKQLQAKSPVLLFAKGGRTSPA
jgi:hypothetical protein